MPTIDAQTFHLLVTAASIVGVLFLLILFYKTGGVKEIKKIWCDIHINPATGAYSQKRLMMSFSFFTGLTICFTQAFTIKIHPVMEFNTRDDAPFWAPLLLFAIALGATAGVLLGHLNSRKTADANGQPLTPPYEETQDKIEVKPPVVAPNSVYSAPVVETEADDDDVDPEPGQTRDAKGKFIKA